MSDRLRCWMLNRLLPPGWIVTKDANVEITMPPEAFPTGKAASLRYNVRALGTSHITIRNPVDDPWNINSSGPVAVWPPYEVSDE